jgi:hypothetical protein
MRRAVERGDEGRAARSRAVNFEEARAEYGRLRQAYDSRQISPEEYGRRVQGLQVRDSTGTYWAIDGNSGGWLRYDGTSWVPGQPPTAAPPPSAGSFGAPPQQGNFGQPQSGFGQPQGGFGQPQGQPQPQGNSYNPQAAYNPNAPKPKRGNRGLLIGCGVVVVLLLLCVGGVVAALATNGGNFSFSTTSGITDAATATTIKNSKPDQKATEFPTGQLMYITYTANRVKAGETLEVRLFRNGTRIDLNGTGTQTFDSNSTYNGYFTYTPTTAGSYRAELYYKGEASPSKTLDFTVR